MTGSIQPTGAAEFEEMHGIPVDEIDAEEREAYTELNAMWSSDELGPALRPLLLLLSSSFFFLLCVFMVLTCCIIIFI